MKFGMNICLWVVAVFMLSACGSSDSSKGSSNPGAKVLAASTEKVTCNSSTLSKYKYKDGTENRYLDEGITNVLRNLQTSADGLSVTADTSGEVNNVSYDYIDSHTKTFREKLSYLYVVHRTTVKTKLPDGTLKDISHVVETRTGKDGYQFSDGNGGKTNTQNSDHTFETISKVDSEKSVDISIKIDGKDEPVHDYVTYTRNDNGIRTDRTLLQTPYSEKLSDFDFIIESDDMICRTMPAN